VDDAIVVVENVERSIGRRGLPPVEPRASPCDPDSGGAGRLLPGALGGVHFDWRFRRLDGVILPPSQFAITICLGHDALSTGRV